MLEVIKGKVVDKQDNTLFLEVGPFVLRVLCSRGLANILPKNGEFVDITTHLHIREDEWSLFGFAGPEEKEFFEDLLGVSGVGPKGALSVLSAASLEQLQQAVAGKDEAVFTQASGIGKKAAQKIILELHSKYKDVVGVDQQKSGTVAEISSQEIEALEGLGYSRQEAKEALGQVGESVQGLQDRVKEALKLLAR